MVTLEEKQAKIDELRAIDDILFAILAENPKLCQEMLRTILGDNDLEVKDVITQASKRNLYGRSVILDALCTLGNGTKCNIEIQRSDNDNHFKRVRFNASSITYKDSNPGDKFFDVLELYIVYISEFDIFGDGYAIYHTDNKVRETGRIIDDGLTVVYVNATGKKISSDDEKDIVELMECFLQKEVNNPKFPELSKEMKRLKHDEGGREVVCKAVEDVFEKGIEKGVAEEKAETIKELLKDKQSDEYIMKIARCTLEDIEKVKADM